MPACYGRSGIAIMDSSHTELLAGLALDLVVKGAIDSEAVARTAAEIAAQPGGNAIASELLRLEAAAREHDGGGEAVIGLAAGIQALADRLRPDPTQGEIGSVLLYDRSAGPAVMDIFLDEARGRVVEVETALLALEKHPDDRAQLDIAFRAMHNLKGESAALEVVSLRELAHRAEDLLSAARSVGLLPDRHCAALLRAVDGLRAVVERLAEDNAAPSATPLPLPGAWRRGLDAVRNPEAEPIAVGSSTSTRLPTVNVGQLASDKVPAASEWLADLPGEADLRRWLQLQAVLSTVTHDDRAGRALAVEHIAAHEGEAVRVPIQRLDALLALVDELRRLHPQLAHEKTGERLRAHGRLRTLLDRLQQESLDLRLVPLADTFQRLHRVGRDTAKQVGKDIDLQANHGGVELDKNVLDRLASPLMHLVRNAIDHGLEANAARDAAGKPHLGLITIDAVQRGNRVEITVADDGAGLDPTRILAKARARGLWKEGQPETAELIHPLIFLPGFSTAEKVSEVSGRGVGLDVVRAVVQEFDGAIRIHTELGKGTRFTVDVPMTMALQDALVVRCAGQRVVIFQNHVRETMLVRDDTVRTVMGSGRLLLWRGQTIPLVDLHGFLDPALPDATATTALVIADVGQPFALGIDEVIGAQRLLVRPLGDTLRDTPGLAGGCLLEDGALALVIDPVGAMRHALRRRLMPKTSVS